MDEVPSLLEEHDGQEDSEITAQKEAHLKKCTNTFNNHISILKTVRSFG
jgi:hypothetical protein